MQAHRIPSSIDATAVKRQRARRQRPVPPSSSSAPAPAAPASIAPSPAPNAGLTKAADELTDDKYDRLLRWACGCEDESRAPPRVAVVDESAAGGGRGLVAAEDVEEGTVLMAVPLSRVFCSEPRVVDEHDDEFEEEEEGDAPWALAMGARLLALVRSRLEAREQQQPQQQQLDGWALWAAALPQHIVTPLDFSEEAIEACGEGGGERGVGAAIAGMQDAVRRGAERARRQGRAQRRPQGGPPALSPLDTDADVLWAVKVLSSRCFFEPSLAAHLCVPGVDMANHREGAGAGGPSARVELARSPAAVQGAHVLDEYFDATSSGSDNSNENEFRLVADRDLRKGDAVTISYGRWPAEVFFLLFGFVPGARGTEEERALPLPGDALLLYEDAGELADHVGRVLGIADDVAAWWEAAARLTPEQQAAASRLAATAEGFDARLAGALAALAAAVDGGGAAPPSPEALVRARVAELLEGYEAAAARTVGSEDEAEQLARAYALTKAATAKAVLAALDPPPWRS